MHEIKDTKQATVHIGYDGRVHKHYHGPKAKERFENEVRVLNYLAQKKCPFVPHVIEADAERLYVCTSNCGSVVSKISEDKVRAIFGQLEDYGVRHEDPFARNVTYNPRQGSFNLIDFEFSRILETGEGLTLEDVEGKGAKPRA